MVICCTLDLPLALLGPFGLFWALERKKTKQQTELSICCTLDSFLVSDPIWLLKEMPLALLPLALLGPF